MLRACFSLFSAVLIILLFNQVALGALHLWEGENQAAFGEDAEHVEWNLDRRPNPHDTSHLVFETVYSLLQLWPNARMRNGHNIVPGIIPKGTLLYHGANGRDLPPGPEWVATDPEHSYLFCRNKTVHNYIQEGCWHFTLATTRTLKVVYFDGSSGANLDSGTLDIQDLLVWGECNPHNVKSDLQRISTLCEWGKGFGVDGFIRMELDFEVMLCSFTSGISLVSSLNLEDRASLPPLMSQSVSMAAASAGSRHGRFPGETRILLDLAGLVSFYDTQLVPSLVAIRSSQERWNHRIGNLSNEAISGVRSRLEEAVVRPIGLSSGIDWKAHISVIVDRFGGQLELVRHILSLPAKNTEEIFDLAHKAHTQLRLMLTPYLPLSATPTGSSDKTDLDWTIPIYKFCATTHTKFLQLQLDSMTESEKLLLQAVGGTSREICRVVTRMWAVGVHAGLDLSLSTKGFPEIAEVTQVLDTWAKDLDQLMTWLDWSAWLRCDPECGPEEMCYIPIQQKDVAPLRKGTTTPAPYEPQNSTRFDSQIPVSRSRGEDTVEQEPDELARMQPRCAPRVFSPIM